MPPRARRTFVTAGRRSMRRRTMWAHTYTTGNVLAASTNIAPLDLIAPLRSAGVGVVGGTVVRTHVSLNFLSLDTDLNPGSRFGLVQYDTSKTTATSPDLSNEPNLDWAMFRYLTPGTASAVAAWPPNAPTSAIWGREIDVKSRRRLHEIQDGFVLCLRNDGSANLTYSLLVRCLVMLP